MTDRYSVYRTFIASPGDVAAERQYAEETIERINKTIRDTIPVVIEPRKWEHLSPVTPNLPEEHLQDKLNEVIEKCNFFILILHKRYGTVQQGYSISNTEREINTILHAHEKQPKLKILSYFRELDPNSDPGEQEIKIRELRSKLQEMGIPYRTYHDPIEFNQYLTHDLYDVILRIQLSTFKKQSLLRFWHFGEVDRPLVPRVAIIYPPVQRSILAEGGKPDYWIQKLANQIAFEDFKAIQKIENHLNLLGFYKNFRVYPHTSPPPDLSWMNRIWLCLPRNRLGLKELKAYQDLRFKLPIRSGNRPNVIKWRIKNGEYITIESPMGEYLKRQRNKMDISGEWHGQLAEIIAKDFAVVARIKRNKDDSEESLWDYFFGGIRGLGTWGAAWFIDKEYKQLKKFEIEANIEMLLEVIYQDGRILKVSDVSDQPAIYFRKENSPEHIEKNIKEYKD